MPFKGLFVGVYASNRGIRVMFLPVLYLLLSVPLLSVIIYYFPASLPQFVQARNPSDILLQVFVSLIAFTLPTRILSGRSWSNSRNEGKRRVQQIPYWTPGLRNWLNIVFGGEGWLKGVSANVFLPLFTYNAAGTKHNVVLSPAMLDQLLEKKEGLEEADISKWAALQNAFGMPKSLKERGLVLKSEVSEVTQKQVFKGKEMEKLLASTLNHLSESLPDLITFNSSLVDQMSWERVANIEMTEGIEEVECELFTLLNEFFCNVFIPPIAGVQFPESYQLLASDLATFNQFYYALATGIPRLFPMAGLPGAVLARNRLLQNFDRLFYDLANPPKKRVPEDDESMSGEEMDADTPTPFTILSEHFTKFDVDYSARAALALEILHGVFSELVPVACWTILHVHKDSVHAKAGQETLIERIRKETKVWAEAVQPPSIHPSFPTPPEISFSGTAKALNAATFPQIRSCINESRRLYKTSIFTLEATKPVIVTETSNIRPGDQEQYELETGSHIDVGLSQTLINNSNATFLSPAEYQPDRFVDKSPPSSVTAVSKSNEPYTTALLVAFVAGILQLWEIAPAPKRTISDHWNEAATAASGEKVKLNTDEAKKGVWIVPKAQDGANYKIPKGEVKVRIRRREGLAGAKMVVGKRK
ncbi:unnamed protein product [Periconia digitata]|uniref:Cytochrome P450 n=1 Tax=Periconia digitata TaxID=1303443 RepID=A0A9W4UCT8_9PLEO|nr:unnamed protein product [Periconia digitata]